MLEKERPQIELYLYSMNQEFSVGKGHFAFLKPAMDIAQNRNINLIYKEQITSEDPPNDWRDKWIDKWFKNTPFSLGMRNQEDIMTSLFMRREEFGGLVFDPVNDRIYKVNDAGYYLLEEIIEEFKKKGKNALTNEKFINEDTKPFIYFLKGAGLWNV